MVLLPIFLSILVVDVYTTPFNNCTSKPQVTSVDIYGCPELPCTVQRGQFVKYTINLTSPVATNILRAEAKRYYPDFTTTEELGDVCPILQEGDCPVEAGEVLSLKAVYRIPENEIEERHGLSVTLYGEDNVDVACASVDFIVND